MAVLKGELVLRKVTTTASWWDVITVVQKVILMVSFEAEWKVHQLVEY